MGRNDQCRYQRNFTFNNEKKIKSAPWNKGKDKTMFLEA